MLLLPSRVRRFRPKVTASAIALTLAGIGSAGPAAEASDLAAIGLQEPVASAGAAPSAERGLFAPRHRPWRHHVYRRDAAV